MKGSKYLSEVIDISTLKVNALNIIKAPTGCGKTYFALNSIPSLCHDAEHEVVYLIDTVNGREQILRNYKTQRATKTWINDIEEQLLWFYTSDSITVMTYALFGLILNDYPDFHTKFRYIICDEMHSVLRFQHFGNNLANAHRSALNGLKRAVRNFKTTVIALTATPYNVIEHFYKVDIPFYEIPIDQEELIHFETKEIRRFTDINSIIPTLNPHETGILYTGRITSMKSFEDSAKACGFRPISIWSTNNNDHQMTEAQLKARETILKDFIIPEEYNLLIINSSSETSIKIKSHVDFMVINSTNNTTLTQVRGRYNDDLDVAYIPMTLETLVVPDEYLNIKLFSEDKEKLCNYLNMRDDNNRQLRWRGIRPYLEKSRYNVSEGRNNNRRYHIITKKPKDS